MCLLPRILSFANFLRAKSSSVFLLRTSETCPKAPRPNTERVWKSESKYFAASLSLDGMLCFVFACLESDYPNCDLFSVIFMASYMCTDCVLVGFYRLALAFLCLMIPPVYYGNPIAARGATPGSLG